MVRVAFRHNDLVEVERMCRTFGIGQVVSSEYAQAPRIHRAVPSLNARLVMSLDDPVEITYGTHTATGLSSLAGLMRPGVPTPSIALRQHQRSVYVELSALATRRLFATPLSAFDAGGVDAAAQWPWVGSLIAEAEEQKTHRGREELVRTRLLDRLVRTPESTGDISATALELLRRHGGNVSTPDLARQLSLSPRQLRHLMTLEVGVGPKFAARIARLGACLRRASTGAPSWAVVAADTGFSDQSHLVGQFQTLMGTTPTQWLAEERRNLQGWLHRVG